MGTVQRLEDLIAWQKARVLAKRVYNVTKVGAFAKDFALRNQIRRAAVSVMANLAEGFERQGLGEFHQFLTIARASCAEVRSHLYIALDAEHLDSDTFDELRLLSEGTSRIISGLRTYIANQRGKQS